MFGHSARGKLGGHLYALAHPERVRGLVLMEPAFYAAVPASSRSPGLATMIESVGPLLLAGQLHKAVTQFWSVLHPELWPEALAERVAGFLSPKHRARSECPWRQSSRW